MRESKTVSDTAAEASDAIRQALNATPKYWLWAIPQGETDRLHERPLTSFALTLQQAAKVEQRAKEDGWHSFRLVEDTDELPDFTKAFAPRRLAEIAMQRATLEREYLEASRALKAIPGVGSGPMGLTPDDVKARPEYREAKLASCRAFAALRSFNAHYAKQLRAAALTSHEREG